MQQFEAIESRVEKLIAACNELSTTNAAQAETIGRLEEELRLRQEAETGYQEERRIIRGKIDAILTKLDGITATTTG
jgi:hypothetical protein